MKLNHRGDCLALSQTTALITISVIHSVTITSVLDCWAAHLRSAGLSEELFFKIFVDLIA